MGQDYINSLSFLPKKYEEEVTPDTVNEANHILKELGAASGSSLTLEDLKSIPKYEGPSNFELSATEKKCLHLLLNNSTK